MRATDVIDRAGITYRQLDHWCRTGRVPGAEGATSGTGVPRELTVRQCNLIEGIAHLTRAGFSLDAATRLATGVLDEGYRGGPLKVEVTW